MPMQKIFLPDAVFLHVFIAGLSVPYFFFFAVGIKIKISEYR
jgi:hypothetical protein